jgi:predicted amidohydrolase
MNGNDGKPANIGRRNVITAAALGMAAVSLPRSEAAATPNSDISVPVDGKYATVPLTRESLKVTAVQSRIRGVDARNPKRQLKENLDRMVEFIDEANGFPGRQDLVCFHEQPIMGWQEWNREDALRVAIEVPGEETEILGKKAKQYGCYVSFGTFAKDKAWPGHLLSLGVLIGPDGNIAARHWKAHNGRNFRPGWELFTTTIYDVLDKYTEMYGADEVLPVARTEIGNLSLTAAPFEPDIFRALAMKGMEISIRTSSGGFATEDPMTTSMFNSLYTIVTNNSVSPENPGFPEFSGAGDTVIYGPGGRVVAKAKSMVEEFVSGVIPIAEFRKTHRIPEVPMALVAPVFNKYVPRYSPGLQDDYIPKDYADSAAYYATKRNW